VSVFCCVPFEAIFVVIGAHVSAAVKGGFEDILPYVQPITDDSAVKLFPSCVLDGLQRIRMKLL